MINLISQIIEKVFKRSILKRVIGEVTELIDPDSRQVKVAVHHKELVFVNKSKEILAVGDEVEIHYWTNISNGYVALRYGTPIPAGRRELLEYGVVTYDGEINHNYFMNLDEIPVQNNSIDTYAVGAWDVSDDVWNNTVQYKNIYLNGYAATYIPVKFIKEDNQEQYTEFIKGIENKYYYKSVSVQIYSREQSATSTLYCRSAELCLGIDGISYSDGQWSYKYALYLNDPNRTHMSNGVVSKTPTYETLIATTSFTSTTFPSLNNANLILMYRGNYSRYDGVYSKDNILKVLNVDIEPVMLVDEQVFFYNHYQGGNNSQYIEVATKSSDEIEQIMAKKQTNDNKVL